MLVIHKLVSQDHIGKISRLETWHVDEMKYDLALQGADMVVNSWPGSTKAAKAAQYRVLKAKAKAMAIPIPQRLDNWMDKDSKVD